MRELRTILIAVFVVLAFAAGFLVRQWTSNAPQVSGIQASTANKATKLQRWVIDELQANYYKRVDVNALSTAGVNGMLKSLNDPWTELMPAKEAAAFNEQLDGSYSGIGSGLELRKGLLTITGVFAGSPAKAAGLRPGDVIVTIDGKATKGESIDASVVRIKGKAGSHVRLQLRRRGRSGLIDVTLTRRQIVVPETRTKMYTTGGKKVGYVELALFAQGVGKTVARDVQQLQKQGAQWIVFDLRYNGGGLLNEGVSVASDFLSHGVVVTTKGLHSPLEVFQATGHPVTSLPMVVLVNRYTASSSEIVAGALQDNQRATLIGTRTFGKGLVQTSTQLADGSILKMTIAVYLTPLGHDINKKGLKPTISVVDNLKTRKDEQLQAALRFIAGKK